MRRNPSPRKVKSLAQMVHYFPIHSRHQSRLLGLLHLYHDAQVAGRWVFLKDLEKDGKWATLAKLAVKKAGWRLESKPIRDIDPDQLDWVSISGKHFSVITGERKKLHWTVTAHRLEAGQMKAVIDHAREEIRAGRLWYTLRRLGAMQGFGL